MSLTVNATEEIATLVNYPLFRLFTVAENISETPAKFVQGQWGKLTTESVSAFSAGAAIDCKMAVACAAKSCTDTL